MPRFFFDVHNGQVHRDDDGMVYADLEMARREGLRASGEMLSEKTQIGPETPWKMVIRDERDDVVATMTFSST